MNYLAKIVCLLLILTCTSCNNHPAKGRYEYSLKKLGQELSEHFPNSEELKNYGIVTSVNNTILDKTAFDAQSLMLYGQKEKEEFNKIEFSAKAKSIIKYNSNDTSLLTLKPYRDKTFIDGVWFTNLETDKNKKIAEMNSKRIGKIPVPYFTLEKYQNSNSLCNLDDGFEIYIIKAIAGRNKNSIIYDCECLPNKWQHGKMSGYALNGKTGTVVFWATIW